MRLAIVKEVFCERVPTTFPRIYCARFYRIFYCIAVFYEAQGHTFIAYPETSLRIYFILECGRAYLRLQKERDSFLFILAMGA